MGRGSCRSSIWILSLKIYRLRIGNVHSAFTIGRISRGAAINKESKMTTITKTISGKSLGVLALAGTALACAIPASTANAASYCGTSSCAPAVVTSHVRTVATVPHVTVVQPRMTVVHRPAPVVMAAPSCVSPCGVPAPVVVRAPAPCFTSCGVAAPVYVRRTYHHMPVVHYPVMRVMRPAVHVAYPIVTGHCGARC